MNANTCAAALLKKIAELEAKNVEQDETIAELESKVENDSIAEELYAENVAGRIYILSERVTQLEELESRIAELEKENAELLSEVKEVTRNYVDLSIHNRAQVVSVATLEKENVSLTRTRDVLKGRLLDIVNSM